MPTSFFNRNTSDQVSDPVGNGSSDPFVVDSNGATQDFNVRGAAGGPYVVVASNFAEGTTAADIESVMLEVGGPMTGCRLIATQPAVDAEMTFVEKSGADAVIAMFNNKKVRRHKPGCELSLC